MRNSLLRQRHVAQLEQKEIHHTQYTIYTNTIYPVEYGKKDIHFTRNKARSHAQQDEGED